MEGRGFGFVTFADPTHAQSFLEVQLCCYSRLLPYWIADIFTLPKLTLSLWTQSHCAAMQTRQHIIDGKKVEAKAAVPRNSGSGNSLTKKMFVGGTVSCLGKKNMSSPHISSHLLYSIPTIYCCQRLTHVSFAGRHCR